MVGCSEVRELILDDLYELLDAADHTRLAAHLTDCPVCAAERARLATQQGLIRRASVHHFPDVQFVPPTTLPFVPRTAPVVLRWVAAATVLLGVLGGWQRYSLWQTHATALTQTQAEYAAAVAAQTEHRQAVAADLQRQTADFATARAAYAAAVHSRDQHLAAVTQKMQSAGLDALLTGPPQLAAGTPGEFRIDTQTTAGVPTAAQLSVKVHDADQRVVYEQALASSGRQTLRLPADLPLGSGLTLDLTARVGDQHVALRRPLLAAPYRTHLAVDRVAYLPGETVFFRTLTLDGTTLRPAPADVRVVFEIVGPAPNAQVIFRLAGAARVDRLSGPLTQSVLGPDGQPLAGVAAGEFPLPSTLPPGTYAVSVRAPDGQFASQERRFVVRPRPVLQSTVTFDQPQYDASAALTATLKLTQANGQPAVGVVVSGHAIIDNGQYPLEILDKRTDAAGAAKVRLRLPPKLFKGITILHLAWHAVDGTVHPLTVAAPVRLNKIFVELFPEGGNLVAGVPNRVYIQARWPNGTPAVLTGTLQADGQPTPTAITTTATSGRGHFTFTPQAGVKYDVLAGDQTAIAGTALKAQATGLRLTLHDDRTVQATNTAGEQMVIVTLAAGGRTVARHNQRLAQGETLSVPVPTDVNGVLRVTAWADLGTHWQPLAERLIYRAAPQRLNLSALVQGERVEIRAQDEQGRAKQAVALVGITADAVTVPSNAAAPAFFALGTPEGGDADWADAQFWLTQQPNAANEVDAFLATQGWRRFVPGPAITQSASAQSLSEALATLQPRLAQALAELDNAQQAANEARSAEKQAAYRAEQAQLANAVAAQNTNYDRQRFGADWQLTTSNTLERRVLALLGLLVVIGGGYGIASAPAAQRGALGAWTAGTVFLIGVGDYCLQYTPALPKLNSMASANDNPFADAPGGWVVIPAPLAMPAPVGPKEATPGRLEPLALAPVGLPASDATAPSAEFRRAYHRAQMALNPTAAPNQGPNVRENVAPVNEPAFARAVLNTPPALPFIIRQYAAPTDAPTGGTIYWHPAAVLTADGKLSVPLPAQRKGATLFVVAHTLDGRIGAVQMSVD